MQDESLPKQPKKRKYRGSKTLTTIFYTLYVLFILAFLGGLSYVNSQLEETLTQYEQSHIQVQAQAAFDEHFASPDWESLYVLAGIEDTRYENASHYAARMAQTLGTQPLSYGEIPAETGHLYQLTAGDLVFGTFRMADLREKGAKWPSWQLDEVSLIVPRDISVQIRKLDTHTVTINGIALDDTFTLRIDTLLAEEYALPGTDGIATHLQQVGTFLQTPDIAIWDEQGNQCDVILNPETGIYEEQFPPAPEMTPEQSRFALDALKAWGGYKLKNTSDGNLSLYFHPQKDAYPQILSERTWVEEATGYTQTAGDILAHQVYDEDHFSVYARFAAKESGADTVHDKSATFFFTRFRGSWTCYNVQPGNVYTAVSRVKLAFHVEDTLVHDFFLEADRTAFYVPAVTAPDGYTFAGWGLKTEEGEQVLFIPDETGLVTLAPDTELQPLVLHAIFKQIQGGS